jgi:hypothetical protein
MECAENRVYTTRFNPAMRGESRLALGDKGGGDGGGLRGGAEEVRRFYTEGTAERLRKI